MYCVQCIVQLCLWNNGKSFTVGFSPQPCHHMSVFQRKKLGLYVVNWLGQGHTADAILSFVLCVFCLEQHIELSI